MRKLTESAHKVISYRKTSGIRKVRETEEIQVHLTPCPTYIMSFLSPSQIWEYLFWNHQGIIDLFAKEKDSKDDLHDLFLMA